MFIQGLAKKIQKENKHNNIYARDVVSKRYKRLPASIENVILESAKESIQNIADPCCKTLYEGFHAFKKQQEERNIVALQKQHLKIQVCFFKDKLCYFEISEGQEMLKFEDYNQEVKLRVATKLKIFDMETKELVHEKTICALPINANNSSIQINQYFSAYAVFYNSKLALNGPDNTTKIQDFWYYLGYNPDTQKLELHILKSLDFSQEYVMDFKGDKTYETFFLYMQSHFDFQPITVTLGLTKNTSSFGLKQKKTFLKENMFQYAERVDSFFITIDNQGEAIYFDGETITSNIALQQDYFNQCIKPNKKISASFKQAIISTKSGKEITDDDLEYLFSHYVFMQAGAYNSKGTLVYISWKYVIDTQFLHSSYQIDWKSKVYKEAEEFCLISKALHTGNKIIMQKDLANDYVILLKDILGEDIPSTKDIHLNHLSSYFDKETQSIQPLYSLAFDIEIEIDGNNGYKNVEITLDKPFAIKNGKINFIWDNNVFFSEELNFQWLSDRKEKTTIQAVNLHQLLPLVKLKKSEKGIILEHELNLLDDAFQRVSSIKLCDIELNNNEEKKYYTADYYNSIRIEDIRKYNMKHYSVLYGKDNIFVFFKQCSFIPAFSEDGYICSDYKTLTLHHLPLATDTLGKNITIIGKEIHIQPIFYTTTSKIKYIINVTLSFDQENSWTINLKSTQYAMTFQYFINEKGEIQYVDKIPFLHSFVLKAVDEINNISGNFFNRPYFLSTIGVTRQLGFSNLNNCLNVKKVHICYSDGTTKDIKSKFLPLNTNIKSNNFIPLGIFRGKILAISLSYLRIYAMYEDKIVSLSYNTTIDKNILMSENKREINGYYGFFNAENFLIIGNMIKYRQLKKSYLLISLTSKTFASFPILNDETEK